MKHLHAAAHKFDIGIYFEANGHGTVIFSPDVGDALEKEAAAGCQSAKYLIAFSKLMNQAVG